MRPGLEIRLVFFPPSFCIYIYTNTVNTAFPHTAWKSPIHFSLHFFLSLPFVSYLYIYYIVNKYSISPHDRSWGSAIPFFYFELFSHYFPPYIQHFPTWPSSYISLSIFLFHISFSSIFPYLQIFRFIYTVQVQHFYPSHA